MSKRVKFEPQPETLVSTQKPEPYSSDDDFSLVEERLENALNQQSGELRVRTWFAAKPEQHAPFKEAVRPIPAKKLFEPDDDSSREEVASRDVGLEKFLRENTVERILHLSSYWKLPKEQTRKLKQFDTEVGAFIDTPTNDTELDRLMIQNGYRRVACHVSHPQLSYRSYADNTFVIIVIRQHGLLKHYIAREL